MLELISYMCTVQNSQIQTITALLDAGFLYIELKLS